jgi:hypothetical protein
MITLDDMERDVIELDARAARHLATLSQNNRRWPVLLGPFYPRFIRVLSAFYPRFTHVLMQDRLAKGMDVVAGLSFHPALRLPHAEC